VAVLKIIGGTYPNQNGDLFWGHITVRDEQKNFIRYCLRGYNATLETVAQDRGTHIFKIYPKDGTEIVIKGDKKLYQNIQKILEQPVRPEDVTRHIFSKKESRSIKANGTSQLLLVAVAALFFFMWLGKEPSSKPVMESKYKQVDTSDAEAIAQTLCNMRVKEGLKAPRTAKYPWTANVHVSGGRASMTSYVDAQNSFGALIRTHYFCAVQYGGGKPGDVANWSVVDFSVIE